jgi:site-specific recombinase XerD
MMLYGNRRSPESDWSWYAVYRENGVKKRKSLGTRNQRIAEKRFIELCDRLDRGILGFSLRPKLLPFIQAARTYLDEGTIDLSKASVERHRQNLFGIKTVRTGEGGRAFIEGEGHLLRFFRNRDLKTIRVKDVDRYIRQRQGSRAAANTILKELATLSAIFRFFLAEEVVLSNPVLAVRKPKLKLVRPNYRPSEDELAKVFSALYPGARRFYLAFCNSGCRLSELRGCNVRDVHLQERALRVVGKGGKERFIPMNDDLMECIRQELASHPDPRPDDPIFVNREGRRYRSLRTPLTRACEAAGVPHLLHHSLRHAYATLQHEQGKDILLISRLLSHSNPTVTQNIYVDPFPEAVRRAGETFKIDIAQKGAKKGQQLIFSKER